MEAKLTENTSVVLDAPLDIPKSNNSTGQPLHLGAGTTITAIRPDNEADGEWQCGSGEYTFTLSGSKLRSLFKAAEA